MVNASSYFSMSNPTPVHGTLLHAETDDTARLLRRHIVYPLPGLPTYQILVVPTRVLLSDRRRGHFCNTNTEWRYDTPISDVSKWKWLSTFKNSLRSEEWLYLLSQDDKSPAWIFPMVADGIGCQ